MKNLTQFAQAIAAKRIAAVNRERERVLAGATEDAVHDLRVSLRRLEPVLDLFDIEPLGFDTRKARDLAEAWLRAAGRVRDCDVVSSLLSGQDEIVRGIAELRGDRSLELHDLLAEGPLPASRARRHAIKNDAEVALFAAITLPHLARSYFRSGARAISRQRSIRRLHEFRLHGKSLRYSLELFQGLYGGRLKSLRKILKRMQLTLGEMADARAGLKLLKLLDVPKDAKAVSDLKQIASSRRDEFVDQWSQDVPDAEAALRWTEYLRRFARSSR